MPADPSGVVDVVSVDDVADAIEALSADPARRGKSFDVKRTLAGLSAGGS